MSLVFVKDMLSDLKKVYEVVLLSSSGPEWEEVRKQHPDVMCIELYMERRISFTKDLKSLWKLWRTFSREKPRMVHSMTPKAGLLCMMAARLAGVPVRVHTFTGLVFSTSVGMKRKILMFTDWLTCACATHIIPEGKGVMDDLQAHITKKPMKVLGYGNVKGVDLVGFSRSPEIMEAAKAIRKDEIFTFIFVGRIVGDKGMNELMEVMERLKNEHVNCRLLIIGRYEENLDPVKPVTLERIKSNPIIDSFGEKFGDELLAYYAASDCFVFPSYREGFPNTVMEAGAMGIPSIVTDINGSREIISDGKNGLIVPSKNVEALYDAMKRIIEDEPYRKKMAKNARPMIESRFEQRFVRKCLMDFYDEIMY
ncbi:MAG: glycosyltransferase family 4 protein [Bacteroidaceae bacterium]